MLFKGLSPAMECLETYWDEKTHLNFSFFLVQIFMIKNIIRDRSLKTSDFFSTFLWTMEDLEMECCYFHHSSWEKRHQNDRSCAIVNDRSCAMVISIHKSPKHFLIKKKSPLRPCFKCGSSVFQ